jgi:hypothetical protein
MYIILSPNRIARFMEQTSFWWLGPSEPTASDFGASNITAFQLEFNITGPD